MVQTHYTGADFKFAVYNFKYVQYAVSNVTNALLYITDPTHRYLCMQLLQ